MTKRLSKYIASFDYFNKSVIFLSATSGSISIATVIGATVGIASASFSLAFSISTGIVKNCEKQSEIKRKSTIVIMLARSKSNSIESKIPEALINNEISYEDFMININEEKNYQELKESIRMIKI